MLQLVLPLVHRSRAALLTLAFAALGAGVAAAQEDPDAIIVSPSEGETFLVGDPVSFEGAATDPDGGTSFTFEWEFEGGTPDEATGQTVNGVTFATPGTKTIELRVTDEQDESATQEITIEIEAPPNQRPTATIDQPNGNVTIDAGDQVNFEGSFDDPDGDEAEVEHDWDFSGSPGAPSDRTVPDPGLVSFNNPGTFTVTYTVTDEDGASNQNPPQRTITVETPDQAPIANIDEPANNASFGSGVQIDFSASGSDPDGGNVSFAWTFQGGNPSTSDVRQPQNVTFAAPGPHTVTLTVTDDEGDTAQDQITIQINDSPPLANILNPPNNATFAPGQQIDFEGSGSDPDGGNVDFDWTFQGGSPPTSTSRNPQNVTFSAPGPHLVTLTVTDNENSETEDQITIQIVNQPPNGTITAPPNNTAVEPGEQVDFAGTGVDPDGGPVTFAWTFQGGSPPASSSQNPQNVTFSTGGSHTVTLTVTDNEGTPDPTPATINIIVNQAPNAVNDNATTREDTPVTTNVLGNDSDPDGNPITVTACHSPTNGTVVRAGNTSCTFTPTANFPGMNSSGTATYEYTISDGSLTDEAIVTVTVTQVNDPPTAAPISVTTPEDTPVTTQVRSSAVDPDHPNSELDVRCSNAVNGDVTEVGNNSCRFTPDPNFFGTAEYRYTVTDPGNPPLSASAEVTVTVTPVNDPPVATDDFVSTLEDVPVTTNVVQNDSDPDGTTPTVQSCQNASTGTVARFSATSCRYTPQLDFTGTATYTYTITDGQGGSDTGRVTVNVGSAQDPPVAVNDAATTPEDTPVTVNVRANDSDPDGDPLTVISVTQPPAGGTASVGGGGQNVLFTPAPNFNGSVNFTYTISDGHGNTGSANVTITVTAVNDLPDAVDDVAATLENTPVTINVLGNDIDVDGDVLTITGVSAATNGSALVISAGTQVRFTPAPGFNGTAGFSYTISDGQGGTDTARVTVSVGAVQDAPTAVDDAATTAEDVAVTIGVMVNDTDPDGDPLSVTGVTQPANGTAALNESGAVTYTPNAGFRGTDTFTYTLSDGQGGTDTATVTVTIEQVEVGAMNVEVEAPGSAGRVDGHDVLFILRAIPTQDLRADVNRDGRVDQIDVQLVLGSMGAGP